MAKIETRWVAASERLPTTDPEQDYCSEDLPVITGTEWRKAWYTNWDGLSQWFDSETTEALEGEAAVTHWFQGLFPLPQEEAEQRCVPPLSSDDQSDCADCQRLGTADVCAGCRRAQEASDEG